MLDFKEEELLPELKARLFVKNSIQYISHPLVQTVFYTPQLNHILNQQLIHKKEALKTASMREDWSQFIWLHERPYRFQVIQEIQLKMERKQFWEILGDIWTDSENIWQNLEDWRRVLSQRDKYSHFFMSEKDQEFLKNLPDTITVYRGYQTKNKNGLSFSLSKTTAEWFANRFKSRGNGKVYKKTVSKSEVFAYMSSRNENEIILV